MSITPQVQMLHWALSPQIFQQAMDLLGWNLFTRQKKYLDEMKILFKYVLQKFTFIICRHFVHKSQPIWHFLFTFFS